MSQVPEKLARQSVYLPHDMLEEVEDRAKRLNLQRGTYLRDLINMGLEIERDNEARGAL